ncbi:tRNA preQ1(34) S-adenosylmethionine ribosyltransferase-isomerase QueA [Patescibacteria group bacterium]|nr:tRNA preQ1(34) S-adenosylmethionine ribosyltransferase-isomerase QueA [Patescibacteria group bacterium]
MMRWMCSRVGVSVDIYDVESYNYCLPKELIANVPLEKRDHSRLLVVDRKNRTFEVDNVFADLLDRLDDDYVVVTNNTRVFPGKLVVSKVGKGSLVEMLFLRALDEERWEVMCKKAKRVRVGDEFMMTYPGGMLKLKVEGLKDGAVRVVSTGMKEIDFVDLLDKCGLVPLPPYIEMDSNVDYRRVYQTVFASEPGSVAAPTAGLHFTKDMMVGLQKKGVIFEEITLHVGRGTFEPVRVDDIREHQMHSEEMVVNREQLDRLKDYKKKGKKILAVGTTSARFLETLLNKESHFDRVNNFKTDLFVYPGYRFGYVDELITNFHLPKSTLLMLVSAFLCHGGEFAKEMEAVEFLKFIYGQAITEKYRFYSFGDAMYIR